ncbi:hypothetical protein GCM10007382_25570 [Salinibacterium xinjiangense]|uniref:Uncharacterized protein n=1 Tax=Salinibacterium xinjiangense TaxID=386302 RepID=A0A2C9A1C4_9MICO|nr:hypothetical protein GCM10007382_25570 [Salinibacterium xinjiangense]SOE72835.1 hypothetical protein SAMN06296378_2632 [Salinibacterium xinjiangense]
MLPAAADLRLPHLTAAAASGWELRAVDLRKECIRYNFAVCAKIYDIPDAGIVIFSAFHI